MQALIAAFVISVSLAPCSERTWHDPSGDTNPDADVDPNPEQGKPLLDVVSVQTRLEPGEFVIRLHLDPLTTSPIDCESMSAYIDIDADVDAETGMPSTIELYGIEPYPVMGAEYYLGVAPPSYGADLLLATGENLAHLDTSCSPNGWSVRIPRCEVRADGICIGGNYRVSVMVYNAYSLWNDRIPNGTEAPTSVADPTDYDGDGDVDYDDFQEFAACASGPGVPQQNPACDKADLDGDDDVDQDDFGIFQRTLTGPC